MRDDINTEFMIQHQPLAEVLAFVVDLEDTRTTLPAAEPMASGEAETMPAPSVAV